MSRIFGPKSDKPRQYTEEEIREEFLQHVWHMIDYWATPENARGFDLRDRLSGFAHSLLAALDGESMAVPGFLIVPNPHPSDKAYHKENGENWYPPAPKAKLVDIGGGLNDVLFQYDPRRKKTSH